MSKKDTYEEFVVFQVEFNSEFPEESKFNVLFYEPGYSLDYFYKLRDNLGKQSSFEGYDVYMYAHITVKMVLLFEKLKSIKSDDFIGSCWMSSKYGEQTSESFGRLQNRVIKEIIENGFETTRDKYFKAIKENL